MSKTHLKTGDALPPFGDKVRLYAKRYCPYAERAALVLKAKSIPHEIVYVDLENKPEWIFNFSPKGTVPCLEYEEGKGLFESNIITVYLDEMYPEPPLQSEDPLRRAADKMIIENLSGAFASYYTAAFNGQRLQPSHTETFHNGAKKLQKELESRGTSFFHGEQPGWIDYTIFPFLGRFDVLPFPGKAKFAIERESYDRLATYIEDMMDIPAVKDYYLLLKSL